MTRKASSSVVMISLEDYEALEETSYLLRSPENVRRLVFSEHAWEDYLYRQKTDRKILQRINALIHDIQRNPFDGVGKPEPLKCALSGYWSRRITDEHRLVYKVEGDALLLAQLRYHY